MSNKLTKFLVVLRQRKTCYLSYTHILAVQTVPQSALTPLSNNYEFRQ